MAQPYLSELVPMPVIEEAQETQTKLTSQEGRFNVETGGNVIIFDEADASVVLAPRRLVSAPSPEPKSSPSPEPKFSLSPEQKSSPSAAADFLVDDALGF